MTKTANTRSCILFLLSLLVLDILQGPTEAALIQQQHQQQQQPYKNIFQQSYTHNSLNDEQRKPARLTSNAPYDHVDDLGNSVVEDFNHRSADGSYEFRYELTDGTARYERGYFVKIDKVKELVVVGYYSYRMPNGQYITVFYNADRYGYRQNHAITRDAYPDLPRTIEVGDESAVRTTAKPSTIITSTTTKRTRV